MRSGGGVVGCGRGFERDVAVTLENFFRGNVGGVGEEGLVGEKGLEVFGDLKWRKGQYIALRGGNAVARRKNLLHTSDHCSLSACAQLR